MTQHVTHRLTYDAPAAEVYRMLTTASFREQVGARMRVLSVEASVTEDAAATVVRIAQVQPAKGLPSFATRIVGDTIEIDQVERWTSDRHADVELVIPGKPGRISGTARLEEADGTTTEVVELDVKVGIPLVGGRLEGLVADMLVKALEAENATGRDYLSR